MNFWTQRSIELANQRDYLDQLYRVYPTSPNLCREMPDDLYSKLLDAYNSKNHSELVKQLLKWDKFPIKDSYVAYLRRDSNALERNPQTARRIAGTILEMPFDEVMDKCKEPKESNRQIGPMFKNWIASKTIGLNVYCSPNDILSNSSGILNISDDAMKQFAIEYLGYTHDKGLDFIGKNNGKYIIAEAKFLTDYGGHQTAQFNDAILTLDSFIDDTNVKENVIKIAILDGVLYIPSNQAMHRNIKKHDAPILSSLLLRDYLYSV
jgi:hypothetical protein